MSSPVGTEIATLSNAAPRWLTVTPTSASPPPATPDPITLLNALRRRWPLALALSLSMSTATATLVYFEMPPQKYKAQSMFQVATQAPRVVLETRELQTDFKTYQKTQEAYIHSRLVLDAALKKEGIKDLKMVRRQADPSTWLEKQVLVDFAFGSEILKIGMTGEDPKELATLVNAVTRAYMEEVVDAELKERRNRQKLLKENWERYQERLKEKRNDLKKLGELAGTNDRQALAVVHHSEQERLARAEGELARIQSEIRSLTIEVALAEKEGEVMARRVNSRAVEEQIAQDPDVISLANRAETAKLQMDQYSRVARKSSDPAILALRRELNAANKALSGRIETLRPAIARRLAQSGGEDGRLKADLARERLDILSRQEAVLTGEVERASGRAKVITRTSVDLASIQDEIFAADEIAKKLAVEIESLNVELQAPARVRLIQLASEPREADKNRVLKVAGGAGLGVCVLCLASVSLWEFRARRIESAHEVESKLGIRVVGDLPAVSVDRASRLEESPDLPVRWNAELIDSVDATRTAILHAARIGGLRVLMVASSVRDEGKTTLACHLAASLARAGRKTLLIDFDLRNPTVHDLFEMTDSPGICEILRGEATAAGSAVAVDESGTWVIPAGRRDGSELGAMARDEVRVLIEEARRDYDFVIVDAAPVLEATDALQVGQHVDAAVLSVMRVVSRGSEVYAACRKLAALGIPLFGAVVTDMQSTPRGRNHFFPYARKAATR